MKTIHWLRSRQEKNELGYWLSFAAYDQTDRSFINRLYLVYLFIFFIAWLFIMLVLFAEYGGMFLSIVNPSNPVGVSVCIECLALAIWNLFTVKTISSRSPMVFSENDASLVCQTPLNRQKLVFRWLWMPWFKNAVLFWLLALTLAFSVAETSLHGSITSDVVFSYFGYGLRHLLFFIPIHLGIYSLQWALGVFRLQGSARRNWVIIPAIIVALLPVALVIVSALHIEPTRFQSLIHFFSGWLSSGFSDSLAAMNLWPGLIFAILALIILFILSKNFNLSRAAQETSDLALLNTAARYGFTDFINEKRAQKRMGIGHKPSKLQAKPGNAIFLWKNTIQSQRSFHWQSMLPWLKVVGIAAGLSLLPTLWTKLLACLFLVLQVSPLLIPRLRCDLQCWMILNQLPVKRSKILLFDLLNDLPLVFLLCLIGLVLNTLFTHAFSWSTLLFLPGVLLSIAFSSAYDILKRSKSDLLITGNVASTGSQGMILGTIGAAIPFILQSILNPPLAVIGAFIGSLLIAWIFYEMAGDAFQKIKG